MATALALRTEDMTSGAMRLSIELISPLINGGVPSHVMAAATNGDLDVQPPGQLDRIDDVGDSGTAGNQGRMFVD